MQNRYLSLLLVPLLLSGCATMEAPRNQSGSLYARQQQDHADWGNALACHASAQPAELANMQFVAPTYFTNSVDILSPGDRLRLTVAGDKDQLTGNYVIANDGAIFLPSGLRIHASGKSLGQVEHELTGLLLAQQLIRPIAGGVKLDQVELGGVGVFVGGAVFESGAIRIGDRQSEIRSFNISNIVSGDQNNSRTLSTALRAAGGLRPDADPHSIYFMRGQIWTKIDLSGALDGHPLQDIALATGDRIYVASTGCLQENLVRPSAITAPGIRVFLSNLSRPAGNNATSAIGKDSTSLPYGTRLLQALVSANCVGGSAMNAGRKVVLMSRNPINGKSIVISRSIEGLVRDNDRDDEDPYLMPGDAIACYDSSAMNLRDVIGVISESFTSYILLKNVN